MENKLNEKKEKANTENININSLFSNSHNGIFDANNNNDLEKVNNKPKKDEKISKKCCNIFCNIFKTSKHTKLFYMKGWRDYLEREGKEESDKSFKILTNLFINDDEAILGLESIRLNPNLVSENKLRNDLEFYIPQLCTFLLFGEMKDIEEFFVFLCKACNLSFFFAHRVHWFLSAMLEDSQTKKDSIINIIKMINTIFKSENEESKNIINRLYVSNSEALISYIKKNNLYFLYDIKNIENNKINMLEKIDEQNLKGRQLKLFSKYKKSKDIILNYSEKEYLKTTEKNIESKEIEKNNENIKKLENSDEINELNQKLKANDFLITISNFELNNNNDDLFEEENDDNLNEEEENEEEKNLEKNEKPKKKISDVNFMSYYSSINFIDHLCDICQETSKYANDFQKLFLYNKLLEINKILPCNVYLPFLKESTRNYIICHIPLEEIKVFKTKTRCPIMLTFELIRIDEINRANEKIISLDLIDKNSKELLEEKISSNYDKNLDYDLSKPVLINKKSIDFGANKNVKKNKLHGKKKFFASVNTKMFSKSGKPQLDILNSKEDKDIENEEKFTNYMLQFIQSPVKAIQNDKFKFEPLTKRKDEDDKNKTMIESSINEIFNDKNDMKENLINNEIIYNENIEDEIKKDENPINYNELKDIFGEPFITKETKLKEKSLFGNLNSYKVFRCIIKTNEDLRQEQFATQLINEFYQIFKLEKTDCWLNTYEIISTGHNQGLVEMVNDSLSLDELKQKTNHISLKDFYINYYGKGSTESPSYKNAMHNLISSLAGYSLVCYFLQIKDRHNANILIDKEGHIIHIDFGFLLSNAPGKGLKFEKAPFKLSNDMVDCLGGIKGKYFKEFRKLLKKGFLAVYKHRHKIIILVEMMWCGHGKNLECFEKGQETIDDLKSRLNPKDGMSKANLVKLVDNLIGQSVDNWRTKWYDIFQYYVQGIFY